MKRLSAVIAMGAIFVAGNLDAADNAKAIQVTDASFKCITDMKPVRHFYVDNLLGNVAATVAVAEKESRDPAVPMVVLSTAHAAKFPDAVEAACGIRPALPQWLADLADRPERVTALPAEQSAVEQFVLTTSRAAQQGAAA